MMKAVMMKNSIIALFPIALLAILSLADGLAPSDKNLKRRQILASGFQAAGTWFVLPTSPASAAKGAAELDFEFYMRDLVGGNKKEGTILPSVAPVAPPPRTLQGPLIPLLLDSECSTSSITVQALIQQIKKRNGGEESVIASDIQSRVKSLRDRASRSFSARSPWKEETVTDQYFFDFTAYALWRVAADLLPDYVDRDKFVRRLGKMLYAQLQKDKLISSFDGEKGKTLSSTVGTAKEILELFKSSQYCKGYKIRGELDDENEVFDELDNDSISTGGTVNCLVSIYEPASLQASLQITGEQSRFGPDFVGTTLAALFSTVGVKSSWETFFVDPEYRPNPKDYFPNEQLFQYTLARS